MKKEAPNPIAIFSKRELASDPFSVKFKFLIFTTVVEFFTMEGSTPLIFNFSSVANFPRRLSISRVRSIPILPFEYNLVLRSMKSGSPFSEGGRNKRPS